MFYLLVVVVGALVGFMAGQYLKGSEHGSGIDTLEGAVGGFLAVLLSRVLLPSAAGGWIMSVIVAAVGAVVTLFLVRQVMIAKPAPATRARRR